MSDEWPPKHDLAEGNDGRLYHGHVPPGADALPLQDRTSGEAVNRTETKGQGGKGTLYQGIQRYNQLYAFVSEAGKPFVYTMQSDPTLEPPRDVLVKSTPTQFVDIHGNEFVTNDDGDKVLLPKAWLHSPARRQYLKGIVLDPTGRCGLDYWNLWRGFAVEPRAGDWTRLREHIRKIICQGDHELFLYVIRWLARLVQHPEWRAEVALVLRGKRGTGKGKVVDWIMRLFGQHALQISNPDHLTGRFNAHLRDCILLFVDEAFFAGDRSRQGILQSLITERMITIEPKNVDLQLTRNLLHVIMASNEDWIVPAGDRERRYCVLDVSDDHIQDHAYFAAIDEQMNAGGLAAMLFDLLSVPLDGFEVRAIPQTDALNDQQVLSLPAIDKWWVEVLSSRLHPRKQIRACRVRFLA